MPIDFRTYQDPGVYIETIPPPIIFNPAIEPTIVAIVGEAPLSRTVTESTVMSSTAPSTLVTLGAQPATVSGTNRVLGTPYVSAAIASMGTALGLSDTSFTAQVYDGVIVPATPFSILIENEQLSVTSVVGSTWTVTRAQGGTDAAAHAVGQVVNTAETYSAAASVNVATLGTPIGSAALTFTAVPSHVVQVIFNDATGGTFTLTYNGETTANIAYNAAAATVQAALVALSNIGSGDVTVSGAGTSANPWIVTFRNNLSTNSVLLIADDAGLTGGTIGTSIYRRGVAANTYLDVEGERMAVVTATATSAGSDSSQTLTVLRGVAGTPARPHGAVSMFENTGADYALRIGAGADGLLLTTDDTLSVSVVDAVRIPNGTAVNFTFEVTDALQFSPQLFDDMDTVKDRYGAPLTLTGAINSPLSLGAQLAFANGATRLVLVATNPSDAQPVQRAIDKLANEPAVNVVCILSGTSSDISYARGHVISTSEQGFLRQAFVGLDGYASPPPTLNDFITKAQQLASERVSLVGPARFRIDSGTEVPLTIPGYYAAAAVAGRHAGLPPQEPLTRKQIFGFLSIEDQDATNNILTAQAYGVLMLFQDRLGRIIVKHGLTTDVSSVYRREVSVVTARDRLRDMIQETLEQGDLIGSAMTPTTPNLVVSGVESALEFAVRRGLIIDYASVKYRIPPSNPTLIEVRFSYRPTLPLNYIIVQFSINTALGSVEFQTIQESPPGLT